MLTQHRSMSDFIQSELLKALLPRQATPNLTLTTVSIDQSLSLELWTPRRTPKMRGLMPSEIEVLLRDRPRVVRIMSKLVWLMGAICIAEDDWEVGDRQPLYDWDSVIEFVRTEGRCVNPIVTRVIFSPQAIIPIYDRGRKQEGRIPPQAWEISPPHWSIIFDDLVPVGQNFQLKQGGDWVSVEIWTGKPIRREVRSGNFYVEYHDFYATNRLGKF
ncbi:MULTISPECIES: hypothetical protein [unclassified Coleofasciculus]|uniref:hypothetical protein n=1 Tax=unclassified Coleofasciculus TaxID=2692782 RepID=UPI00187DE164|nr:MULTISPECIES: hypothetical protein [unclassified Coleofasciculus]MBE9129090.1 hypothetical protein [Coleofasciculus sp. LEGE 07081]MBE9151763.1 hypothetical protein [Coleofasciculus sp. LEGE 07092]